MGWWLSVGVGIVLMGGYVSLRVLTHRVALRRANAQSFLIVELGGMGGRMLLLLAAVGLILSFVPVRETAFVGVVLLLLVLSLIFEVRLVMQRAAGNTST